MVDRSKRFPDRGPARPSRAGVAARRRLWVGALAVLLTGTGCSPMDDLLVAVFGRSMREQPSIGPYENPRMPAEGSVPFAAGNFPAGPGVVNLGQPEGSEVPAPVTPFDIVLARESPTEFPHINAIPNPVPATAASLARGEQLFARTCVPCHGVAGDGAGLVTEAGVPSWSLLTPEARALTDGYLYTIIRAGRSAMPTYGHQITHFDRWHVVNYVRQLQGP